MFPFLTDTRLKRETRRQVQGMIKKTLVGLLGSIREDDIAIVSVEVTCFYLFIEPEVFFANGAADEVAERRVPYPVSLPHVEKWVHREPCKSLFRQKFVEVILLLPM